MKAFERRVREEDFLKKFSSRIFFLIQSANMSAADQSHENKVLKLSNYKIAKLFCQFVLLVAVV